MTALALARHASPSGCDATCGLVARQQVADAERRGTVETAIGGDIKLGLLDLEHRTPGAAQAAVKTLHRALNMGLSRTLRPWVRLHAKHLRQLMSAREAVPVVTRLLDEDPTYWRSLVPGVLSKVTGPSRGGLLEALARHGNREVSEDLRAVPGSDVAELRRHLVHQQAPRLFIRSFGPLVIHRGGWQGKVIHVPKRRLRLLLGVLVAYTGQALTRDMVLDLLWPEADPAAAVNSLNQTVFQLRRLLDPAYRDGDSPLYVISNSESVQFNGDLVRTDLSEFRRLASRVISGDHPDPEVSAALIALVRGEFLSDVRYEDWAWNLAMGVHNEVREVLLPLASGGPRADAGNLAVRAACALVGLDAFDESAQIALADRLAESGRLSAARDSIAQFSQRVREELGDEPSNSLAAAVNRFGHQAVTSRLTKRESDAARG